MMKMNTKNLGTLTLLAVFVLVLASAGSVMANVPGKSTDATLLEQSRKHYVMALDAYSRGNYGMVQGQLQAAASIAERADTHLANLLLQAADCLPLEEVSFTYIAGQLAVIYNTYNGQYGWNLPYFDPGNPTASTPDAHAR